MSRNITINITSILLKRWRSVMFAEDMHVHVDVASLHRERIHADQELHRIQADSDRMRKNYEQSRMTNALLPSDLQQVKDTETRSNNRERREGRKYLDSNRTFEIPWKIDVITKPNEINATDTSASERDEITIDAPKKTRPVRQQTWGDQYLQNTGTRKEERQPSHSSGFKPVITPLRSSKNNTSIYGNHRSKWPIYVFEHITH